jgi:menaquinone-9 beta-reductase
MQDNSIAYEACIVGGGLAGLSLSILLAKANLKVVLIEKKAFPHHKVCGEYISLESWNFLQSLGVPLSEMQLPIIKNLTLTQNKGTKLEANLPLGGFGISRNLLDETLYKLALQNGVQVLTETNFLAYTKNNNWYEVQTNKEPIKAALLFSAIGKHSTKGFENLPASKNEYIGIKYHLKYMQPLDNISLHAFEGGYAGISAIENGCYCFCYLVKATQLKKYGGDIEKLEREVLSKNEYIKDIRHGANFLWDKPEVISNIYFGRRKLVRQDVIYLGDSAGAIPPLCGNGMSMALRSAHLLAPLVIQYFSKNQNVKELIKQYELLWTKNFSIRIRAGIIFQNIFFLPYFFKVSLKLLRYLPWVHKPLIRLTHGKSY